MPQRIQLLRTKGSRKPEGAIIVSRSSKWRNPFTVRGALEAGFAKTDADARALAVAAFRDWLIAGENSVWWFAGGAARHRQMVEHLHELAGRDLACDCPPNRPCHGDVLLEICGELADA